MSTQTNESVSVEEKVEVQEPAKYNVMVHDNDISSYEEVIFIVSKAFNMDETAAFAVARRVDLEGKGVCFTGSKEVAEMKIVTTNMLKELLVSSNPSRIVPIMALMFTVELA